VVVWALCQEGVRLQTMSGRCSEEQAWSMGWGWSCSALGLETAL